MTIFCSLMVVIRSATPTYGLGLAAMFMIDDMTAMRDSTEERRARAASSCVGFHSPTPPDVTAKIQGETRRVLALPDVAQRMKEFGATPVANAPAEFGAIVAKDTEKWRNLVSTARIKIE